MNDYYHRANEEPPEAFRAHGPITGTKKDLAKVLGISSRADRRTLDAMVAEGYVWAQRIHHRLYRIWFRNKTAFDTAKKAHEDNQRRRQEATASK
jgi:predicted ArsR family transcriptional regulator